MSDGLLFCLAKFKALLVVVSQVKSEVEQMDAKETALKARGGSSVISQGLIRLGRFTSLEDEPLARRPNCSPCLVSSRLG
jgi:hypothetical protein